MAPQEPADIVDRGRTVRLAGRTKEDDRLGSGRRLGSRQGLGRLLATVSIAIAIGGCGTSARLPPPRGSDPATGFPLGRFAKEIDDPSVGRVRLVWAFEPDGRYAEIPFALDGQALNFPTVRGTWTADDSTLVIDVSYPPEYAANRHGWRRDGELLWTYLISSDDPEDVDWFAPLDVQPWRPFDP
jgi:hypothetical protein